MNDETKVSLIFVQISGMKKRTEELPYYLPSEQEKRKTLFLPLRASRLSTSPKNLLGKILSGITYSA
jgi:hypothetical protein